MPCVSRIPFAQTHARGHQHGAGESWPETTTSTVAEETMGIDIKDYNLSPFPY